MVMIGMAITIGVPKHRCSSQDYVVSKLLLLKSCHRKVEAKQIAHLQGKLYLSNRCGHPVFIGSCKICRFVDSVRA
jgi:hypothetical protein